MESSLILSGNRVPFRWSISCWAIRAGKPSKIRLNFMPFLSYASIVTWLNLSTIPHTRLVEKQPSLPSTVSSEKFVNSGFINTSSCGCLPSPTELVPIITILFEKPICGAASPTSVGKFASP